jgi:hypothetical protein
LPQGFELDPLASLGEVINQAVGNNQDLENELASIATSLANKPNDQELQKRYDTLLQRMESIEMGRAEAIWQVWVWQKSEASLRSAT